jgi:hypothetical protein
MVKKTFTHYWRNVGRKAYLDQLMMLRQNTGEVLRVDFTYNFVNCLCSYDDVNKEMVIIYEIFKYR